MDKRINRIYSLFNSQQTQVARHGLQQACHATGVIKEVVMRSNQEHQEHNQFQPPSVGALMDPQYLRDTVRDNNEGGAANPPSAPQEHPWRDMMHSLTSLFRRH